MLEELEERLQEMYKKDIKVSKDEIRFIFIRFGDLFEIPFIYQSKMTFEVNLRNAKDKIENEIIKMYRRVTNDKC